MDPPFFDFYHVKFVFAQIFDFGNLIQMRSCLLKAITYNLILNSRLENSSIKIFDMLGREVAVYKKQKASVFDVSKLQAGKYLISVQNGEKSYYSKFFKL